MVLPVTVNSPPGPAGSITGTALVCQGATGIGYSVTPVSNAASYLWTLPVGAVIASGQLTNSITVNYSSVALSGNITVQGNNICGNGTLSPDFPVTVNITPPAPVIDQQNDSLVSSAPAGNQWYGPGGLIAGATGDVYMPYVNGDYYDIVTMNGCSSDVSNTVNFVLTGVSSISRPLVFIYPNPAVNNIHLETCLDRPSVIVINLMSITGTTIKAMDLGNNPKGLTRWIIDCNDIREGIYFLKVTTNYDSFVQKVILKK
jgi:hypothetical protein